MNRNWNILIPDWTRPLGKAHFDAWSEALGARQVKYADFKVECWSVVSFWGSKWLTLRGCLSFCFWALSGFDRKFRSSSGFIIGHHVVEFRLRKSSNGRFDRHSLSTFLTYVDHFKYAILARRVLSEGNYMLHLVGDEPYTCGILAQVSSSIGIPTFKLRAWGEQATIWPFNCHILFGGPDFHSVSLKSSFNDNEIRAVQCDLLSRLQGDYTSLSYMSNVNRSVEVQLPEIQNRRIFVMYLHDFVDSPGVYGETVFHDQWDWIKCAVREVKKMGGHLLLKLHSNTNPETKIPNEAILEAYGNNPKVTFIDRNASLTQIIRAYSPKAMLTMYGSVIIECACLNLPVIYTSHNPYVALDFGKRVFNKAQFSRAMSELGYSSSVDVELLDLEERSMVVAKAQMRVNKLMLDSALGSIPIGDVPEGVLRGLGFDVNEGSNFYDRREIFSAPNNWTPEHHRLYDYVKTKIIESSDYQALMLEIKESVG